jgi:hypothetical protein
VRARLPQLASIVEPAARRFHATKPVEGTIDRGVDRVSIAAFERADDFDAHHRPHQRDVPDDLSG